MALTGAPLIPTLTNWDYNTFANALEPATYQVMVVTPVVDEATRLYNSLTIRKHARIAGTTLAGSSDGTGLTYLSPIGVPVSVTPVHSVVPTAYSSGFDAQSDFSVDRELAEATIDSLAELTETNVAANFTAATQFLSDTVASQTMIRQGLARLKGNTNGKYGVGKDQQIYGFFSTTQEPALQNMPEVNSAEMRGDEENPYIRGIWTKGFGFVLNSSTVIPLDANGWHNALMVPSGMVTSWNVRSRLVRPSLELSKQVIAENNMGSNIKHDARIFVLRTTTSAA